MKSGDSIHTPAGNQWVIFCVVNAEGIRGMQAGNYLFVLRPVETPYGDDIIFALLPENVSAWTSETVLDEGDLYDLAGETFAVAEQRDEFVKLRREDGTTEWAMRWRVAFNAMRGRDVSQEAEWREALPEEI